MVKLKGYNVVKTPLRHGKSKSSGNRYVFTKEHAAAAGGGRTMFLANVDDDCGALPDAAVEARVRRMLEPFGAVDSVELGDRHRPDTAAPAAIGAECAAALSYGAAAAAAGLSRGGLTKARFAHVRFSSSKALKRALAATEMCSGYEMAEADDDEEAAEELKEGSEGGGASSSWKASEAEQLPATAIPGLAGALARHWEAHPQRAELQQEVDSFMEGFDAAEEERQLLEAKKAAVDDDGFITVSYKKRKLAALAPGEGARAGKKKKKGGELQNFYRFQMREAKREQLVQLRQKFEADKARVARMKEARKFKPF